ncbi:hypothetical protein U9M48_036020 [Paspalum notatum var. saurae]|uniref:Transposon protein, putative, CACTA, En/Spm sub-class n=1 Tax=Paspalum notatum var. saurae TaxID=547442 RepID=A0AAQ3UD93_PASNO
MMPRKIVIMKETRRSLLYPDYKEGHKKLRITLELLQWKVSNGVSDKGFNELLMLIKNLLPKGNKLPATTYEAKDFVCPLGLEVQKIHACPNDCILYRRDYKDLESCPVCKASHYNIKCDDAGDIEGKSPRNKKHAKVIQWHKEECKQDDMLRHPADGSQWRKIERTYLEFTEDARNIRFGLSMDGMNLFSEMSSSHSTWPMTLCMYNLPPWLCVKRKFIMMPSLIQVPKQPGNDIDVYLQLLVEELLLLWTKGVIDPDNLTSLQDDVVQCLLSAGGVMIDPDYGMTIMDLKNTTYRDEPFVLAVDLTQVFYVKDMSTKPQKRTRKNVPLSHKEPKRHIVLPGKRKIMGVEDIADEEDYNQLDDAPPFRVEVDTSI